MSILRAFASLLGCAVLCGCTSYSAPRLSVAEARVAESSADGYVIEFVLDAQNVNEVELPLREVRYTVALGDHEVFSGVRSGEATLRRFGTQRVVLPASIAGAPPGGSVHYTLRGEVSYTTPGEIAQILFDAGVSRPTVSFHEVGQVDLTARP